MLHKKKIIVTVWWSAIGVIHYSFLEVNETINAERYCNDLAVMHARLSEKRPALVNRRGPILRHDNARPHVARMTVQKLTELGYETLPHPPYSPDLSPTDYHLFKHLSTFLDEREVMTESAGGGGAGGWAGWAVGAITSKFYKSNISDDTSSCSSQLKNSHSQENVPKAQPVRSASQSSLRPAPAAVVPASAAVVTPHTAPTSNSAVHSRVPSVESYMQAASDDLGDKWSDDGGDWQAMEDLPSPEAESGWENDNWDPLEIEPEPVKRPSPSSSNSSSSWSSKQGPNVSKDERAALREQKKDDRQKQIEAKRASKAGPLKLGMKKT
ncbi:Transposase type 1 [Trinorchestia longiramus]|nr:Transposase type 1 [Trinorchestia longiramus]